ncbi:MAG: acyl-CoA dehydrogenase [uncultured archaeon A07HB70]|nr:MAG: acyl-CoA dehydrogenase [uncultured archaeon A07HB70]
MDFDRTADRRALDDRVTAWREEHEATIRDHAERSAFPRDLYEEGMERGFGTAILPPEYGGPGGGAVEYGIVAEQTGIFQICFQTQRAILTAGTAAQRERYLPAFADGSAVGAISISEPETGSSLKSMDTTVERDGDGWVVDGFKSHVNLAAEATVHLVFAAADEGLTVLLVDDDAPGIEVSEKRDPIGTRYLPIYDVAFDEVPVDDDAVLLGPGDGYEVFFETFNFSRIGNASEMLGRGKRSLRRAVRWARDRTVGDQTVTEFQGIRWKIADLYTDLRAATRLRDEAAHALDDGDDDASLKTSMAKLKAADAGLAATTEATQITGAHGLYRDQPYEANFRDVKTLEVAGGSREIMRNVIADAVVPEL